jgi:hypothetical protein
MKIVKITWWDSTHVEGWQDKDQFQNFRIDDLACTSWGMVLQDDPDVVAIVQSLSPDQYAGLLVLPRVSIKRIEIISEGG